MNNNRLSPGFVTVDAALEMINAETREEPNVDISRLAENIEYLAPRHNFTIFLIKRNKDGKIVPNGNKPIYIANDYEKTLVEHAIITKFEELSRLKYNGEKVRKISTSVTDADSGGNSQGRPIANLASEIKVGDNI